MKTVVADYRYRVLCLRIVPKVGSTIYLTHYPQDLVMGGHTYLSTAGYDFTGYSASTSASAGMVDLQGICGLAGIGFDQISSGVFDSARCYLFATTWNAPVEDEEEIVASVFGKTTITDGVYQIEEMALIDVLNQSVGDTYTAACLKKFGGQEYSGCMFDLTTVTFTGVLDGVTDRTTIKRTSTGEAADYFIGGTLTFTSGANVGLKAREIKSYALDGTIIVFDGFHYLPVVGDAYTIIAGCRKRRVDCIAHGNILNFGGFSDIPTSSQYSQIGSS